MTAGIDPVIRPIDRLSICTVLDSAGATEDERRADTEMKFGVLRDLIGLSDAALTKQLGVLETHGYVRRVREYGSTRAKDKVWVSLTASGHRALRAHLAALRQIADTVHEI
ncbi:transcriptional regulator [Dietzia alimentaria]|uniref:transcriptional regulator n=1 Tax=Dietzia alimentaria TaxID=665550 RepID=UPI00029A613C|nr:transcriptional regulator [Dietzia alimentaria]